MGSSLARLITAATFALAGSTALAANMAIDTANPANGDRKSVV